MSGRSVQDRRPGDGRSTADVLGLPSGTWKWGVVGAAIAVALLAAFGAVVGQTQGAILFGTIAAALALGVAVPLAILAVTAGMLLLGPRLRRRAEGLELAEDVRGPLGNTYLVRGRCGGREVRVFWDRIDVAVDAPHAAAFESLAALVAHATSGGYSSRATESAWALLQLGATSVSVGERRTTVWLGRDVRAADVVPHAVALAQAPALVRVAAPAVPSTRSCPYCHVPVEGAVADPAVRCPACDAVHHTECWREHRGCAVYRCRRAPAAPASEAEPDVAPAAPAPVPADGTPTAELPIVVRGSRDRAPQVPPIARARA